MPEQDIIRLIGQMSESLHREIEAGVSRIETAVRRHSGLIHGGTLAIAAMERSITELDARLTAVERELRDKRN